MITHTHSTSGRTHRITHRSAPTGRGGTVPGVETVSTVTYAVKPQFFDQVQGDLIRRHRFEHPGVMPPVGWLPVRVDPSLDEIEMAKPRSLAQNVTQAAPWDWDTHRPTRAEVEALIVVALAEDRKDRWQSFLKKDTRSA